MICLVALVGCEAGGSASTTADDSTASSGEHGSQGSDSSGEVTMSTSASSTGDETGTSGGVETGTGTGTSGGAETGTGTGTSGDVETGTGTGDETGTSGDVETGTGSETGTSGDVDTGTGTGGETGTSGGAETSTSTGEDSDTSSDETSTGGDTDTGGCESPDRAVKLGRLIDPVDGSVLEDAVVVVHGDRVAYVGTDPTKIPCGAEIVDWSAYSGIPGIVDTHTHFVYQTDDEPGTFPWSRSWWLFQKQPAVLTELAREAAVKTVQLGVTTAIDKGAGPGDTIVAGLRDQIAAGELVGPRIYTAGYGISGPVPSIAVMKTWIHQNADKGADLIKVWADSCSDDTLKCSPNFTFEQLKAAVDEAHLLGKPIAIHAYHADTAKLAIMAGPDSMEHPEGLDAVDFMDMIAMGITYVPTIDHNRYYKDNLAYFGYDPAMAGQFEAYIAENLATASAAHLAGVKIALGSDAVFSGFGENKRELEWFIEAGMSPLEALRAATITGAASIGVDDEVGRVAVGYFADIVAVEGDPLADIDVVLTGVRGVLKSGRVIALP